MNQLVYQFNQDVVESSHYTPDKIIGKGAYGIVFRAKDVDTGERVAIKRQRNVFKSVEDTVRTLREIKILRLIHHPNVVTLKTILTPRNPMKFNDLYMVFEYMDYDMRSMLKLNLGRLCTEQISAIMFQMLQGVDALHAAEVFHRDLKPQNILLNRDCTVKICDFGLSRVAFEGQCLSPTHLWTNYVVTRWYRPPELCSNDRYIYNKSIDVWSLGCIFVELFTGKPMFRGYNQIDQLATIIETIGKPGCRVLDTMFPPKIKKYIAEFICHKHFPMNLKAAIGHLADDRVIDLVSKMLSWDPSERPTVKECMEHAYFDAIRDTYARDDPATASPSPSTSESESGSGSGSSAALDPKEFEFETTATENELYLVVCEEIELHHG